MENIKKLMKKEFIFLAVILLLAFGVAFYLQQNQPKLKPQESPVPASIETKEKYGWQITEVATNLAVPWDMALAPNGDIFITEREGYLKLLTKGGELKQVAKLSQ